MKKYENLKIKNLSKNIYNTQIKLEYNITVKLSISKYN